MTWVQFLTYLTTLLQVQDTAYGVPSLNAILPYLVQRAEDLIFQDAALDFLATRQVDDSPLTTAGSRAVAIPTWCITVEGVTIVTPANTAPSVNGATRIPYLRTSRMALDMFWPQESVMAAPDPLNGGYWAMFDFEENKPAPGEADQPRPLPSSFLIGPTPNDAYRVEVTGTFRPAVFSASNSPTFLSTYYPSLLMAATMVSACSWQRDWSAQADDPKIALSWEAEYQAQRAVAIKQSIRQKGIVGGFMAVMPPPGPLPTGPRVTVPPRPPLAA